MKKTEKRILPSLLTLLGAALLIVVDQWLKQLAVEHLKPQGIYPLWDGVFQLTYVENHGAAFGIFAGEKIFLVWITGLLLAAMVGLLLFRKITHPCLLVSFGLIIGGGVGNLIERVLYSYVVDYLHVTLINFAVFNFADCCVVVGTLLLLVYFLFFDRKESDPPQTAPKEEPHA